jgi:hypothetical protein
MVIVERVLLSWMGGALLLAGGCVGIERGYPDRRYFVITSANSIAPTTVGHASPQQVLLVGNLRVSPRYDGKSFVYRRSEAHFESDFYNQFLAFPGAILTEEVRKGVAAAGIFQTVIAGSSRLDPTHLLEGSVNALYGDFRGGDPPRAVLEMEFFLTRESASNPDILLQRQYQKSVSITGASAEALVRGWSRGLAEIIEALVVDLKAALPDRH